MRKVVRVNKMPEKHPWVQDEDYYVLLGSPIYGHPIRITDETGEAFQICTDPTLRTVGQQTVSCVVIEV